MIVAKLPNLEDLRAARGVLLSTIKVMQSPALDDSLLAIAARRDLPAMLEGLDREIASVEHRSKPITIGDIVQTFCVLKEPPRLITILSVGPTRIQTTYGTFYVGGGEQHEDPYTFITSDDLYRIHRDLVPWGSKERQRQ